MTFRLHGGAALAALLGTGLILSGCTQIRGRQGFLIDENLVSSVQPGTDNRDSVQGTLGRPSFTGQFTGDADWYYVSRETRQRAFGTPKPAAEIVLHIHFDESGKVASVQRSGVERVAAIKPWDEKTPTLGRDRSFFEELFGNIGQVGAGASAPTTDNPG